MQERSVLENVVTCVENSGQFKASLATASESINNTDSYWNSAVVGRQIGANCGIFLTPLWLPVIFSSNTPSFVIEEFCAGAQFTFPHHSSGRLMSLGPELRLMILTRVESSDRVSEIFTTEQS